MHYRLRNYGGDILLEITETCAAKVEEIKKALPIDVQARLIGHRIVGTLAIP